MKKQITILCLLFCLFNSNLFAQIPTNGLVAWYPFNGNANSENNLGINGIVNGALLTSDRFGNLNSAYEFDGINDYISFSNDSSNTLNSNFTISVWVMHFTGYGSGSYPYSDDNQILSKWGISGINNASYTLGIKQTGKPFIRTHNGSSTQTNLTINSISTLNIWHHYVCVLNNNVLKFYIDNFLIDSVLNAQVPQLSQYNLDIGREGNYNYSFLNGKIDDIRLYKRALSNVEIKALYQEGVTKPLVVNQIGCLGTIIPPLTAIGSNIKWYSDSTLTNLIYQGNTFNTGQTAIGTYKYYVTQTIAGIEGPATIDTLSIYSFSTIPATPTGNILHCSSIGILNYNTLGSANADSYIWNIYPQNAGSISGTTTTGIVSWNNSFSGMAYIKVKAVKNSCQSDFSDSIAVTVLQSPIATITPNGVSTFCQGNSLLLNANTGSNLQYQWKKDGNIINNATYSFYTATQSGAYTVTITNQNNCSTTSTPVNTTVNPLPPANITAVGSTTICAGQSVTLNANTGSGLSYQWQKNSTNILNAVNSSYLATQAGAYRVVVTNSNNCSDTSSVINIAVNPSPTATITAIGNTSFCQGDSVKLKTSYGSGLTYKWQKDGTDIPGATDTIIVAKLSGNYSVIVTNSLNCSSVDVKTVTVYPLPNAFAGNDTSVCSGDSIKLTATGGATYLWNNGVVQGISFVPQTTSTYLVNVTSVNGCSSKDSLIINVNPVPAVPTITQNGFALLSSSATNNQWFSNGMPIAGATSQIYNVTASGFYSVQVSNNYGCKAMSTIINVGLGIDDKVNNSITKVYPNPVSNELIIEMEGNKEKLDFEILNSLGQVIYSGKIKEKSIIQTNGFAPGVYLIKIKNGKNYVFKKIIKE